MWRDQPVSRGACAEHSDATLLQKSCMEGDIYLSVLARLFYSPCCVKFLFTLTFCPVFKVLPL